MNINNSMENNKDCLIHMDFDNILNINFHDHYCNYSIVFFMSIKLKVRNLANIGKEIIDLIENKNDLILINHHLVVIFDILIADN